MPPADAFVVNTLGAVNPPPTDLAWYSSFVNAAPSDKLALDVDFFSTYGMKSPTSVNGLLLQPNPKLNGTALLIFTA